MENKEKTKIYKHIDTNILLLDVQNLKVLAEIDNKEVEVILVISETVIDEMDSKKSLMDELGFNAREFGRLISSTELLDTREYDTFSVVELNLDGIPIEIASKKEYTLSSSDNSSISNDLKIIEIIQTYSKTFIERQIFISNDVMARIRATLNKYNNGLSVLLDSCTKDYETDVNLYGVTLHKVARSAVSEFAEKLFTNKLQLKEG